jgi:nucleoside-diphosphate-sugar epimerase
MGLKIFVAGASGAIGRRLVPLLIGAGHDVVGTSRSAAGADMLRGLGAEPVIVDVFDAQVLSETMMAVRPQIVIHQLTGLAAWSAGRIEEALAENARVRRVGTRNLVDAACACGAQRMIAQSIAWIYASGRQPHIESDPLDETAEGTAAVTVRGVMALEQAVLRSPPLEGIVLRYGRLYGPGTWYAEPEGEPPLHVDAAAYAALLAVDRGAPGSIFNIAEPNELVSTERAETVLGWRPDFRLPGR